MEPMITHFEMQGGTEVPLPEALARLYGRLAYPRPEGRPYIVGNFVTTLDGVVTLSVPGKAGGGPISGNNPHDRMLMGVLRAWSDAVIVAAGTVRASPRGVWTPEGASPSLAEAYAALRANLGKAGQPLTVLVTGSGTINPEWRVLKDGEAPVLIVTTEAGGERLRDYTLPDTVAVKALPADTGRLTASQIVAATLEAVPGASVLLTEGGPQLIGDFLAEDCLDELFLTLAPQIAGRELGAQDPTERPGLVLGKRFAPEAPLWLRLRDVRQAGDHLFMRYAVDGERK